MIHINSMTDLDSIQDDPDLYRETVSWLLYCQYEILEYGDYDDHDFNLFTLDKHGKSYIMDLVEPVGSILTRIEFCDELRLFRRLVYPSEIVLYEESVQ